MHREAHTGGCGCWFCAGITLLGVWPVALVVRSPEVLARVSQASVTFVFAFAAVVAYLALGSERARQPAGVMVSFDLPCDLVAPTDRPSGWQTAANACGAML